MSCNLLIATDNCGSRIIIFAKEKVTPYSLKEKLKTITSIVVAMVFTIKTNKKNHQNSDRDALPEKVLYFEKHVFIDSLKFILFKHYSII